MKHESHIDLAAIEMLVLDVDGVLTDGRLIVHNDGTESKYFDTHDGHGIRLWQRAGLQVALLSGRACPAVERRAEQLGIAHVMLECHFKRPAIEGLLRETNLTAEKAACIGDDLPDLPVIRYVGFGVAVANAVAEVKEQADYVTTRSGGRGAVREVIEYILKNSGRWDDLMERYRA
jgi:3-deoxy-D-manno-octulosonate 8-phosphate phosphatase (KDO 8-P phosphatase)